MPSPFENSPNDERDHRIDPDELALARLFEVSEELTPVERLHHSHLRLCENQGICRPPTECESAWFEPLREEVRAEISFAVQEGCFGGNRPPMGPIISHPIIIESDGNYELSVLVELRDSDLNNFLRTGFGLHRVSGPAFIRASCYRGEEDCVYYEPLLTQSSFERECKALLDGLTTLSFAEIESLFVASLICDAVESDLGDEDFGFEDILSAEVMERYEENGCCLRFETAHRTIEFDIGYSKDYAIPIVEVAEVS